MYTFICLILFTFTYLFFKYLKVKNLSTEIPICDDKNFNLHKYLSIVYLLILFVSMMKHDSRIESSSQFLCTICELSAR